MVFASGRCLSAGLFLLWLVAQVPVLTAQEAGKSHAERFSSPQEQSQLIENETSARLQANPLDQEALLERGLARLRLGRMDEALADLNQAASLQPPNANARAALAYAYLSAGQLPQALEAARASLQLDPRHASAHFYAGRVLLQSGGDLREAIEHLETSANRNPEDVDVQFELFAAYRRADDTGRAVRQLAMLRMLLPPQHPGILYAEGLLQADLGNLGIAIERFRRALKANPALDSVRQDLGVALAQTSLWKDAVEVLMPLVQSRPDSFAVAYFHALALKNSQRASDAEAEARRALALSPDSADAQALVGIILAERGSNAEALEALTHAVQLDPKHFEAGLALGRLLVKEGRLNEGIKSLEASVVLVPSSPEAHYQLGLALRRAGRSVDAEREFATVEQLNRQRRSASNGMGQTSSTEEKP